MAEKKRQNEQNPNQHMKNQSKIDIKLVEWCQFRQSGYKQKPNQNRFKCSRQLSRKTINYAPNSNARTVYQDKR